MNADADGALAVEAPPKPRVSVAGAIG